jgi:hypothetical protein
MDETNHFAFSTASLLWSKFTLLPVDTCEQSRSRYTLFPQAFADLAGPSVELPNSNTGYSMP